MSQLTELLNRIPVPLWTVLTSAVTVLSALVGIYFTNRANERRLKLQLQSDRKLRRREREMAFRLESYAQAAEALSVISGILPKFSDLKISNEELNSIYQSKAPALAKVNLIASEDTVRALADFAIAFSAAFLRLMQQRFALIMLQADIDQKLTTVKQLEKDRETTIELLKQQNIQGVKDALEHEATRAAYALQSQQISIAWQELRQLTEVFAVRHRPFSLQCFDEASQLNKSVTAVTVAARKELELSLDKDTYAQILYDTHREIAAQLEAFSMQIHRAHQPR